MPNYIFDSNDNPFAPIPSLADSKSFRLQSKLAEKMNRLAPPPEPLTPSPEELSLARDRLRGSSGGSGLLDMAEASLYRGKGLIADSYANVQQNVLGNTDYQLSPEVDNLSDTAYSDAKAGYTGRDAYNTDVNTLSQSVADNRWGDALWQGALLAPRALADSAASGAELAVGSLATAAATAVSGPVGGLLTGAAIFGAKAKKAVDTVDKIVTMSERLQKGPKALAKAVVKATSRTSLMTADLTEQMRQDFIKETGNEPTRNDYLFNIPIMIALNSLELGLITKLAPKFSKPSIDAMKKSVADLPASFSGKVAKRVIDGSQKVFKAAGAEAGQEYLQTWQEILAPKVNGDTLSELVASAQAQWGVEENQTQSKVGALLGGGAGGLARGVAATPGFAGGLALDTTIETAKTIKKGVEAGGRMAKGASIRGSLKLVSQEKRDSIKNDYEIEKQITAEQVAIIDTGLEVVNASETFKDIKESPKTSEEFLALVTETQKTMGLMDEDLTDPKKLKAFKAAVTRQLKAGRDKLELSLKTGTTAEIVKQMGIGAKNLAKQTAKDLIDKVPKEVAEKAIEAAKLTKTQAKIALAAVSELNSSSAYGLVEMGIKGAPGSTKYILRKARVLGKRDLRRLSAAIKDVNPDLYKELTDLYDQKKGADKTLGQKNSNLITEETIPKALVSVAETGNTKGTSDAGIAFEIKKVLKGKIADKTTLKIIKAAVEAYKQSPAYTNVGTKGRIDETNMAVIEKKLVNAEKRLNREFTGENFDNGLDAAVAKGEAVIGAVTDKVSEVTPGVLDKIDKGTQKVAKGIDKVINATTDLAEKLSDKTPKEKRVKKLLTDKDAIAILQTVTSKINRKEKLDAVYVEAVTESLNDQGYTTDLDLADFIEQFPTLTEDKEFYKALQSNFKPEVKPKEETDTKSNDKAYQSKSTTKADESVVTPENSDNIKSTPVDSNSAFKFFTDLGLIGCSK